MTGKYYDIIRCQKTPIMEYLKARTSPGDWSTFCFYSFSRKRIEIYVNWRNFSIHTKDNNLTIGGLDEMTRERLMKFLK